MYIIAHRILFKELMFAALICLQHICLRDLNLWIKNKKSWRDYKTLRKFPKVAGGLTTILVYIPQNRAAVLTLIRLGRWGVQCEESEFSVLDENACRWMLGKVDWSTQIELLKNQNKMYSTLGRRHKGSLHTGQQRRASALVLTMLLSRHLNCVNIAGEISSYLKKEKEVPIFL